MTVTLIPSMLEGQYAAITDAGPAVITKIVTRPEDGCGNYTDGGDSTKLIHDIEIETDFTGEGTRTYYGHADMDSAVAHLAELSAVVRRLGLPDFGLPRGFTIEQIDRLVRAEYEARAMSPRAMSDEDWSRTKSRSRSSIRIVLDGVLDDIDAGDIGLSR